MLPTSLLTILSGQDGAMTTDQALTAGLTYRQLRTLLENGWSHPTQGVYVTPSPADPFRSSLRAALLACPDGVICGVSAARLHGLAGLPRWTPSELPHVLLPAGQTRNARRGVRRHSGLREGERTSLAGLPVTSLARTVTDLASPLRLDDLICVLDSALAAGWVPGSPPRRGLRKFLAALAEADGRSESALETLLRLLLSRAGLSPEALQVKVSDGRGRVFARLDMAWPSVLLAVEADGREYHDAPQALYRDRIRANDLELSGWTILRFTWADLLHRPEWIIAQVRRAINPELAGKNAV